jgi:hypothetical protein
MTNIPGECPKCGDEIKKIPAGISKRTDKPYGSFLACKNPSCDWTMPLGYRDKPKDEDAGEKVIQVGKDGDISNRLDEIDSKLQKIWAQIININLKIK